MREHFNDPYVQLARKEGWRSRAAFKLMEIDDKDKLLKRGEVVVDLGATPGGWAQVAVKRVGDGGLVFALDLLEMEPIHGVDFIQGDFREDDVLAKLKEKLKGRQVGLVMSDMAPNMSGVPLVDQARIMHLAELSLEFALAHMKPEGAFLVKVFQGTDYENFIRSMREAFQSVVVRKPDASRDRSAELYLLGRISVSYTHLDVYKRQCAKSCTDSRPSSGRVSSRRSLRRVPMAISLKTPNTMQPKSAKALSKGVFRKWMANFLTLRSLTQNYLMRMVAVFLVRLWTSKIRIPAIA